jgi:hypothetical protein
MTTKTTQSFSSNHNLMARHRLRGVLGIVQDAVVACSSSEKQKRAEIGHCSADSCSQRDAEANPEAIMGSRGEPENDSVWIYSIRNSTLSGDSRSGVDDNHDLETGTRDEIGHKGDDGPQKSTQFTQNDLGAEAGDVIPCSNAGYAAACNSNSQLNRAARRSFQLYRKLLSGTYEKSQDPLSYASSTSIESIRVHAVPLGRVLEGLQPADMSLPSLANHEGIVGAFSGGSAIVLFFLYDPFQPHSYRLRHHLQDILYCHCQGRWRKDAAQNSPLAPPRTRFIICAIPVPPPFPSKESKTRIDFLSPATFSNSDCIASLATPYDVCCHDFLRDTGMLGLPYACLTSLVKISVFGSGSCCPAIRIVDASTGQKIANRSGDGEEYAIQWNPPEVCLRQWIQHKSSGLTPVQQILVSTTVGSGLCTIT